jgi:hypothetical protein
MHFAKWCHSERHFVASHNAECGNDLSLCILSVVMI